MAFLMLLHEKMRLQRKVNTLTFKQLRASNKKERITKNIERLQKYYSKKSDNLQKQAQMMQNQASVFFQNMMGVGAQNQMFNPFCYQSGTAGMTTAAAQIMQGWNKDIPVGNDKSISADRIKELFTAYANGQITQEKDNNGNVTGKYKLGDNVIPQEEWSALQSAMSVANSQVQQRQYASQQMSSQYQSNVSIWLQAQEAQLEAEQDEVLLPLKSEETEMDLERESYEMQLADAKAR